VALILVIGSDPALLEGVSQALGGAGHQVTVAHDVPEAMENLHGLHPLVAIVNRDHLINGLTGSAIPLAKGGALVTYRTSDDEPRTAAFPSRRAPLAELQLPLERKRLLALVKVVEDRAKTCGHTPDELDSIEDVSRG
jgi:DNA-binding NtrC family response regulator